MRRDGHGEEQFARHVDGGGRGEGGNGLCSGSGDAVHDDRHDDHEIIDARSHDGRVLYACLGVVFPIFSESLLPSSC